jgi:DNA polymerase
MRTGLSLKIYGLLRLERESSPQTAQDFLTITLPVGRKLFYPHPFLAPGKFGNDALHYMGVAQGSKKWSTIPTFGGKLVENVVQAIARDCLAEVLLRLNAAGYRTVFHVHDEAVVEHPADALPDILSMMAESIPWAPGLLLKGDGFVSDFYKKE